MIILDTLDFALTMHCPACRKIHRWTRADAWVDDEDLQAKRLKKLLRFWRPVDAVACRPAHHQSRSAAQTPGFQSYGRGMMRAQ